MNSKKMMIVRLLSLLVAAVLSASQGMAVLAKTADAPSNPVYHSADDTTDWDYVYFGSYPQAEVEGVRLTDEIVNAEYDSNGDAWVDGTKYRRFNISQANNTGNFASGGYRYFKWQRIRWRVLQSEQDTLMLMADLCLDCKDYNTRRQIISWETSSIRKWLNDTFINSAFNGSEKNSIVEKTVENDKNSLYQTTAGQNTLDRIYLLSFKEAVNSEYGFYESVNAGSKSRTLQVSDYAYRMGAQQGSSERGGWWLRTPGRTQDYASYVSTSGQCDRAGMDVDTDKLAVVPVLNIRLSSDEWHKTDDGTSGYGGENIHPLTVSGPVSRDVKVGEKVVFQVEVSGGDPSNYTYEWFYAQSPVEEGKKLEWLNSAGVEMVPSDLSMDGIYLYCIVSDGKFVVTSNRAKIFISRSDTEKKAQKITAKLKNGKIAYGSSVSLGAKTSGNGKLKYKSSNSKVLAVSSSGKITVKGYGTATIKIQAAATEKYKKAAKKIKLTVIPKKVEGAGGYARGGKVYFSWKADSSASGYQYSVAYNVNGITNKSVGLKTDNSLTMNASGVSGKITLQVRAYKKVGSKTYYGSWSSKWAVQL
ncbi:MAG: hypothetical protein HFH30_06400 [Eubacterium sp.]|nr:hypothetical protein [Eubacterium sp.]MCI8919330.1 hypothetical protein [Eubacterium sp.]